MKINCSSALFKGTLIILISLVHYSCHAKGDVARYIEENKHSVSEFNISKLNAIDIDKLRNANDNKQGAFYYAGLLWYLNNNTIPAEIAWKRAARTGTSPWKEESMRLVCYLLIREYRYNQIPPFLEGVTSTNNIMQDPELFSYYSLALWQDKQYKELQTLLNKKPKFQDTLRKRITITQAHFNFDMWQALLIIKEKFSATNEALYKLFIKYPVHYTHSELFIFLNQIPSFDISILNDNVKTLFTIRDSMSQEDKNSLFDLYLSLPPEDYTQSQLMFGLINTTRSLKNSQQNKAIALFESLLDKITNKSITSTENEKDYTTVSYLNLVLGELQYQQDNHAKSIPYFRQAMKEFVYDKNFPLELQKSINIAKWHYLNSIIHANITLFFPEFIDITNKSSSPEFFANLLEEALSFLLQHNNNTLIKTLYTNYFDKIVHQSHKVELMRWQSILSRIDSRFKVDLNLIKNTDVFISDLPFDYLVNIENPITTSSFIHDWTFPQQSNTKEHVANDFIRGYVDYGLIDYGYSVALENVHHLHHNVLALLSDKLNKKEFVHQTLTLIRIAAAYDKTIIQNSKMLNLLYPIPYLDIIQTVTSNHIEQALLLAIMREESSFDYNIVSYAGAIGLTQLLLPTAKDIATRIDFNKQIQLTNPRDNIMLGYHYFIYLIRVLDSPLKAIASYNGGLGNVWKWEDRYNSDNLIVFADSLPFRETRNYIRKVSSSAMIYGLLYFDISPKEFQQYLLDQY